MSTQLGSSFLQNHFLIAMPGMGDERFARTVVYLCAHNDDGAMGIVINRDQHLGFLDILVELGILDKNEMIRLPSVPREISVRSGGPVDESRGFVLHSKDYLAESSLAVSDSIYLTATVDILRVISTGGGPSRAIMALGYSGWAAGQLEAEIVANGWLACPASPDFVFDTEIDTLYDRVLAANGIDLQRLSLTSGHA